MHSLRIHGIVDTCLTHLSCKKKVHIQIFSFKTTHLLYMHVILVQGLLVSCRFPNYYNLGIISVNIC